MVFDLAAQMTFWAFAAVMGMSMSYIFIVYTGVSIVRVFLITIFLIINVMCVCIDNMQIGKTQKIF